MGKRGSTRPPARGADLGEGLPAAWAPFTPGATRFTAKVWCSDISTYVHMDVQWQRTTQVTSRAGGAAASCRVLHKYTVSSVNAPPGLCFQGVSAREALCILGKHASANFCTAAYVQTPCGKWIKLAEALRRSGDRNLRPHEKAAPHCPRAQSPAEAVQAEQPTLPSLQLSAQQPPLAPALLPPPPLPPLALPMLALPPAHVPLPAELPALVPGFLQPPPHGAPRCAHDGADLQLFYAAGGYAPQCAQPLLSRACSREQLGEQLSDEQLGEQAAAPPLTRELSTCSASSWASSPSTVQLAHCSSVKEVEQPQELAQYSDDELMMELLTAPFATPHSNQPERWRLEQQQQQQQPQQPQQPQLLQLHDPQQALPCTLPLMAFQSLHQGAEPLLQGGMDVLLDDDLLCALHHLVR